MQSKKAIIIGSGVAGLASAVRLAVQGFEVEVYEKNNYPGGKLHAFEQDGFRFDAGPSLFTQPQNLEELFMFAGESIETYFKYHSVPIACKYFYEDGTTVNAYTDSAAFSKEIAEKLGEAPGAVETYLSGSAKIYDSIGSIFLQHSLQKRKTWFNPRIRKAIAHTRWSHIFNSLHQFNQQQFNSPKTIQLFDRFATYNGSNPYQAPGMLSLIPHLEMNQGTFYPEGGMASITAALYELAQKKGAKFFFNKPVQRIIHHEGKVKGVVVDDRNIEADVVVSNVDAYLTYKHLLLEERQSKKIARQERSSSAVVFYWGLNKSFPQLQLHNIFFSNDYKKEFDSIFTDGQLPVDPTVYVNITSKMEAGLAPAGKENWFVMINAPVNMGQDWRSNKQLLRGIVTEKLGRALGENVNDLIVSEQTLDPVLIGQQTACYKGALYGTSSNSKWAAFLRPANFSKHIKGMYLCGGTVHPGGGIPLCLKSAKIVSELIAADLKKWRH